MDARHVLVTLRYNVRLRRGASGINIAQGIQHAFTGFEGIPMSQAWRTDSGPAHLAITRITAEQAFVTLALSSRTVRPEGGGLAQLAGFIFGNPFRSAELRSVRLMEVTFGSDTARALSGPRYGLGAFAEGGGDCPPISVPIPHDIQDDDLILLVEKLAEFGVSHFVEGPLTIRTCGAALRVLEEAKVTERGHAYFTNGAKRVSLLRNDIQLLTRRREADVRVGFRLCPISVGLNSLVALQRLGIPVFTYNLFHRVLSEGTRYAITPAAMATILRAGGSDIMNVGLQAREIIDSEVSSEVVRACVEEREEGWKPSCPLFTGGITPRVAHAITSHHGARCVLHVGKTILRSRANWQKLRRNVLAIREAASAGLRGETVEEVMRAEGRRTANWRAYEQEYGPE